VIEPPPPQAVNPTKASGRTSRSTGRRRMSDCVGTGSGRRVTLRG
jgi:hypothetical protein